MTEPTLPPDDSDVGWGEPPESGDDDLRRLLDERPPHHDRDDLVVTVGCRKG